jgi:hypothetical protein
VTNIVPVWLRSLSDQSIDDEEEDRADSGDENPSEVERFDLPETDKATEKTADDRASDADEDRDNDSAGVFPGHDELGEGPGNEAQEDPGENTHASFLGLLRLVRKANF